MIAYWYCWHVNVSLCDPHIITLFCVVDGHHHPSWFLNERMNEWMEFLFTYRKHTYIFFSCTAELLFRTSLNPERHIQIPSASKTWLNMSFVLNIRKERWAYAAWTLSSEPRGQMSLEAILEARDFTGQLGGLQSNDREYRTAKRCVLS